jgi:Ni/Co efflux regulator RcnB
MNKSLIAVAVAALLLGSATSASAQSYDPGYYSNSGSAYDNRYDPRYDERYDERYDPRYDDRYDNRQSAYNRNDRDCDGIADRYDRNDARSVNDRDCDGINNRFDRHDGRHHNARHSFAASRYHAPAGYRYARYSYGTRLPRNYWGNSYYVDYQPYGLSAPPMGYRWNRVGNDVYLVSTRDGLIAQAVYSLFR